MAATVPHVHQLAVIATLLAIVAVVSSPPAAATDTGAAAPPDASPVPPLAARLHRAFSVTLDDAGDQDGGGTMECWGALTQLSWCTSEILLFLFNGESYIGPECCRAIRGATRHCWPAMLAAVGFTAEQADVLRGFCDGEAAGQHQQHGAIAPPAAGNNAPAPGRQ